MVIVPLVAVRLKLPEPLTLLANNVPLLLLPSHTLK